MAKIFDGKLPSGVCALLIAVALPLCAVELPVRETVLYKNGVGYFVRSGTVPRGEAVRVEFRTEEMDDILKSLLVRDASGSPVAGVRYDSAEPWEKKLREFPFQISPGAPLSAILDQFRGSRLTWTGGAAAVLGARVVRNEKGEERESLALLNDDGTLRTVDPAALPGLRFAEPAVDAQFRDYLRLVAASRSRERKALTLDVPTSADREIQLSYLAPAAVWKSAYRLVIGAAGGTATAEVAVEGWAIVDNTSGEDWTNVRMALVSGRPVSFRSRLFAPRFIERPFADVSAAGEDRPEVYESAVATVMAPPAPPPPARAPGRVIGGVVGGVPGGAPRTKAGSAAESRARSDVSLAGTGSSVDAGTTVAAADVGELFEYRFSQPVTVRRNESALLPFLSAKLPARKLLIWNSGPFARHAIELVNGSGQTLDGGPVTVFEDGAYGGEALMETIRKQDKRLISYALDQGTQVTERTAGDPNHRAKLTARRGVIERSITERRSTAYVVRNADAKGKSLLIEHPVPADAKIVSPAPAEQTATHYRFALALRPAATETLTVTEEKTWSYTIVVSEMTPDDLVSVLQDRDGQGRDQLTPAARQALEAIVAKKRDIAGQTRVIGALRDRFSRLEGDQARLRENLRSLGAVSGQEQLVQQYARQLAEAEAALLRLRTEETAAAQRLQESESQLAALIERLEF